MITFKNVSVRYEDADSLALRDASFTVPEGDLALVIGGTGSGKSTLLNCVNGLVPHFTGGTLSGGVTVAGRDTSEYPPRELADVVGIVRQDPRTGFVTDTVEDELAYTMESLAIDPDVMRRRVEETLDILGLVGLRHRTLRTLSGGECQRVAIGSTLTVQPKVLVLDEPTSALDPQAAEEVLAAIQRLVHDLGLTVLMSEHRLERVVQYADQILIVKPNATVDQYLSPPQAMRAAAVRPPIVELGMAMGWDPLPLSIRDARRAAASVRGQLVGGDQDVVPPRPPNSVPTTNGEPAALSAATVRYGDQYAVSATSLTFPPGEITALMGRNGAGKSSTLKLLAGSIRPSSGRVRVSGDNPADLSGSQLLAAVAFVPQDPDILLWAESVAVECAAADQDAAAAPGTCAHLLNALLPGLDSDTHPRDLSVGSRLLLVLAIMLTGRPKLLILDEPTRGLDYPAKHRLGEILRSRADDGTAVILATHDVEFVASLCDRVVILADGEVVTDDSATRGITGSPAFAPQVAKIMAPLKFLTVDQVRQQLPSPQVS